MAKISKKVEPLVMLPLCALFFFIGAVMAQAATYFVATTGSDANPGTSGSPFLTIQKCINTVVAGDTCSVNDGTYTVPDATRHVGLISPPVANGTTGAPITLKSTNPLGAQIVLPHSAVNGNTGVYVSRSYWIIEGFDISGGGVNGQASSNSGVVVIGATGTIIRNNLIHHIAYNICTNSTNGNTGFYLAPGVANTTIDNNVIHSIGRLLHGVGGCSLANPSAFTSLDHGAYIEGAAGVTITRNIFYNNIMGWPISVWMTGGGTVRDLIIHNNTFADKSTVAVNRPYGQIGLQKTLINASIKNNISYDAELGFVFCHASDLVATNVVIDHNLSSGAMVVAAPVPGVTVTNSITSTSPGFVNAAARNYALAAGSAAINAGTSVGLQFKDAAPDIGAYEFPEQAGDSVSPLSPVGLRIQ